MGFAGITDETVSRYTFTYTCAFCAGDTKHLASGRATEAGTRTTAMCKCVECNREYQLILVARSRSGAELEGAA